MELYPAKNVVILKDAGQTQTKSGLVVPQGSDKNRPEVGIVLKIGAGKRPLEFKEGDKIVFRKYMENRTFIGSEEFNFIDFKDIVAVIKDL